MSQIRDASPGTQASRAKRRLSIAPAYLFLVVLLAVAALSQPRFLTVTSLRNTLIQSTALGIVAVGQTMVILTSGIDLSVGATISLSNVLAAVLMQRYPGGMTWILPLCLGAGLAIGLVNGVAIAYGRLVPFIITLAVGTMVQGLTLAILSQPGGLVTAQLRVLARGSLGLVPLPIILLVALYIVVTLILTRTPYGLSVYAVGGNENSARLSGIRTKRVLLSVYLLSSLLAAAAGVFLAARIGSGDPRVGDPFSLDAITAAILGGTSLFGGVGTLPGTLAGVLIIGVLSTVLNMNNISPFYQWIVKGLILIIALTVDFWRKVQRREKG